ncbi:MAG: response regulator [Deltaproteobacteria bacterium]|nr:response regulator [Deltaproteobacteria bacterium]
MLAGNVYHEASDQFTADQTFSSFLSRLSQDENWHSYLLGDALRSVEDKDALPEFGIKIDQVTKLEIETPFRDLYYLIQKQHISKKELVDCIVKAEFSEWNSIYLYALRLVGDFSVKFQHAAATIEAHKQKIIKFLDDLPEEIRPPADLFRLPVVWNNKILIIEEDTPFREFLSDLLGSIAKIEQVSDSGQGLEKIHESFFNAVISDMNMKMMSGIDLYNKAVEANPDISRNFLFYLDEITPESKTFFKENHLSYLKKPLNLKGLTQTVEEIMEKAL